MKYFLILFLLAVGLPVHSQQGPRMSVTDRVEREKNMVYDSINGLNEDQKLLIDQVYSEVETSMTSLMGTGDRTVMREGMMEIQQKKMAAMKDILSTDQFTHLERMMQAVRNNRRRGPDNQ